MTILIGKILLAILLAAIISAAACYAGYKFAEKLDKWEKRRRK